MSIVPVIPYKNDIPYNITAELMAPNSKYLMPPSEARREPLRAVSKYELIDTNSRLR